jgi:hypothetical protein
MLDPYTLEEALSIERQILSKRQERQAIWTERVSPGTGVSAILIVRRRLARALLALADRLDPRAVVRVPHVPARPAMNGTLHHA